MKSTVTPNDEVVCLACGFTYPASVMKRGLCPADYQQFVRVKSKASPEEVPKLESLLISQGKLLPDGRATDNPFAAALAKVRESQTEYSPQELADFVDKKVVERKAKTPKQITEAKTKGTR